MTSSTDTVGGRIRRLRQAKGLSQRELASDGVTFAYISRIENGQRTPSVKALRKIAAKLGCSVSWLEFGSDPIRDLRAGLIHSARIARTLAEDTPEVEAERRIYWRGAYRSYRDAAARLTRLERATRVR